MIRLYPNEEFREVEIDYPLRRRYAVSNRGRLMSFKDTFQDGILLKGGVADGYKTLNYKMKKNGKIVDKCLLIYRLVAELFIPKPSADCTNVLHLDYSRNNDIVSNLKWTTWQGMQDHRKTNPKVMNLGEKVRASKIKADGAKLTSTKVIHLKKLLKDPERKTRLKMLAKQFGISEMQVSRIKNGQNWGHIIV